MKKLFTLIIACSFYVQLNAQCEAASLWGMPDEMIHDQLIIPGGVYGNPYTMFDRRKNDGKINIGDEIQKIRRAIKEDYLHSIDSGYVYDAYKSIYDNAAKSFAEIIGFDLTTVTNSIELYNRIKKISSGQEAISPLAQWAKNNAFVFLIGLDNNLNFMDTTYYSGVKNYDKRNGFRARAMQAFDHCDAEMASGDGAMQFEGKTLIMWTQCYDILKTCYELSELHDQDQSVSTPAGQMNFGRWPLDHYANDRNMGDCSPRNRLRYFAREFYCKANSFTGKFGVITSITGWKKNHGLMAAAALGMAGVVLNEAGASNWSWRYKASNWMQLAVQGIDDCLFVGDHDIIILGNYFAQNVPQTNGDGTAGIAEGPAYWSYAAENLIPAWVAMNNMMLPMKVVERGSPFYFLEQSYLQRPEIQHIFKWFDDMLLEKCVMPPYDNTGFDAKSNIQALTAIPEYNHGEAFESDNYDLNADYIVTVATHDLGIAPIATDKLITNANSGNLIIRKSDGNGNRHYFHMLGESGTAVDKAAFINSVWSKNDGTHEDDDMGSFMIGVFDTAAKTNTWLAIDPPYFGSTDESYKTNHYLNHNTINFLKDNVITNASAMDYTPTVVENTSTLIPGFTLAYMTASCQVLPDGSKFFDRTPTGAVSRNVNTYNSKGHLYYMLNDYLTSASEINGIEWQLNGNGVNSTYSYNNRISRWTNDSTATGWGLMSHSAFLDAGNYTVTGNGGTTSAYLAATLNNGIVSGGIHSRTVFTQQKTSTIVQTFLYPYRCKLDTPTPTFIRDETSDQVSTLICFRNPIDTVPYTLYGKNTSTPNYIDTVDDFHLIRSSSGTTSKVNPFNIPNCIDTLTSDGMKIYASWESWGKTQKGRCENMKGVIHLRKLNVDSGTFFKYNDTLYFEADATVANIYLEWQELYKYKGYFNGNAHVRFYLRDMIANTPMTINSYDLTVSNIHYSASPDSAYHFIDATFNGKGTFWIDVANPCDFDCYFPPTSQGVDTIFDASDKKRHTLGHKLTIKQSQGLLHISNGTRIDMCEVYLRNCDSLIIEGDCQEKYKGFDACSGIEGLYKNDPSSAIIVSAGSALVLDSGSYTYLKHGGAIWVKQNGSLIIRNGAFVQIGDENYCGYGEIITEAGAYLYIDSNAHIEFYKNIEDTVNRNLFNVRQTYAGIYYPIDTILRADTISPNNLNPIPICALDTVNPIKNREWGYCNFMHPLATYKTLRQRDTLCPGEPVTVDLRRILNSSHTEIVVCRMDSIYKFDINNSVWYWQDTCVQDTFWRDSIGYGDSPCVFLHTVPDFVTYYFHPNTLHRITINTRNDCGVTHDTVGYIFIADSPRFTISVPATACPGFGTFTVNVVDSNHQPVFYHFEITEIPDTSQGMDNSHLKSYSYSNLGYLPDSFRFDTFELKGKRSYEVTLTVTNSCGGYTQYGTVSTPFEAKIKTRLASTYTNPVGPAAVQLQGIVKGATSYTFSWNPTTYLDQPDSLNPVCTPPSAIQYVFTATDGTCTDRDTVNVSHNEWAYAGNDTEVCYNQNVILGTDYMAAAWLGLIWHSADHAYYDNIYNNYQQNDSLFAKFITHYLIRELADFAGQQAVDNFMNNEDLRSAIFRDANFISYYNSFISLNGNSTSFDNFNTMLSNNSTLQNLVENTYQYSPNSNFLDYNFCQNIFVDYTSWRNANSDPFETKWERLDDTTWTNLSSDSGYFNCVIDNTTDKYYRITVINHTANTIEYDQVLVKRDSIVTPAFHITFQMDSTIFFADASHPNQHDYLYSWDFGDGGTSTYKNPYHTFSGRDTSFLICLTVRDSCGTYTKCDTLKIDTFYNTGLFGKTGLTDNKQSNDKATSNNKQQTTNNNYLSVARPNPFSEFTIAEYSLSEGTHNAEIRITTMLGLAVKTYKIKENKGMIAIDGTQLRDGMYYYYLVVDGVVVGKQIMLVQK